MAKDNNSRKADELTDIPHEREGTRPDFSTPPPRKKLPKDLQATLDDDEKLWDILYEGKYVHSTRRMPQLPSTCSGR